MKQASLPGRQATGAALPQSPAKQSCEPPKAGALSRSAPPLTPARRSPGTEEPRDEHLSQEPVEGCRQPHKAARGYILPEAFIHHRACLYDCPAQNILRFSYPDADTRPWRLLPGSSSQDKVLLQRNIKSRVGSRVAEGNNSTHMLHSKRQVAAGQLY